MARLIVNTSSGEQRTIQVGIGGGYSDPESVIWDERNDGELSSETLALVGGLVRNGNALDFSQQRKDQHDAALATVAEAEVAARRESAIAIIASDNPSTSDLVSALKALVLLMVDELNILRQCNMVHRGIAGTAAVNSIGTLKTAMLNNLPVTNDRTLQQAKTALENKLNAGDAD